MTPREILEAVKDSIRKNPNTYNQEDFCGTTCCIAGHIDIIVNGVEAHVKRPFAEIPEVAARALGLDDEPWLFGVDWEVGPPLPNPYTGSPKQRAEAGCAAIDRYLAEIGA